MSLFCQLPFADNFFFLFFYLTAKRDVVEEDHALLSVVTHSLPTGDSENVTERRRERERERERERQRSQLCLDLLSAP